MNSKRRNIRKTTITHTKKKGRTMNRTIKKRRSIKKNIYKKHDYNSGEGMLTSVWGPTMWHYLHTMSFNYPVKPTKEQKKHYMNFIKSLVHVLPCKYCRINLVNNFKNIPLRLIDMKDRNSFSKYIYKLHEHVNKMLGKKSGLTYNDVRERYEHFRARCTLTENEIKKLILERNKTTKSNKTNRRGRLVKTHKKEKGCTSPLYGKKSKCILKIVPHDVKCNSFEIDEKCIKKNII